VLGATRAARRLLRRLVAPVALVVAAGAAAPPAATAQAPAGLTTTGRPGLAVGLTEFNPNLLWPAGERALPEPFARWRDEVDAVRPAVHRLVLSWPTLQPAPARPADLDVPNAGCARAVGPCLGWPGVREQLRALAARQRATGAEVLVVITGTPAWAASSPSGCKREQTGPRARPPRPDALPAYRRLVADVLAAARDAGVALRWWAPWNEPNHPVFISPQRAACDPASPTLATAPYARLFGALRRALAAAPGDQRATVGELSASVEGSAYTTSIGEFVAALPARVVCAARVWTMHGYVGRTNPVPAARAALAARGCSRRHAIWVTETGLGFARSQPPAGMPPPQDAPGACARLHAWLEAWHADPQVTVAMQYTFREDPAFPVGLVPAGLERAYPTLRVWRAWGGAARPDPTSAAPTLAEACGRPEPAAPGATVRRAWPRRTAAPAAPPSRARGSRRSSRA